jgi:hypothetical protein
MQTRRLLVPALFTLACADLTEPSGLGSGGPAVPSPEPVATAAPTPNPVRTAVPMRPPTAARISASHILVAYKGANRSQATRSKAEAQKIAEKYRKQALEEADFAALAKSHSDDPTTKVEGGSLGQFERGFNGKSFSDAAFALKPGEISAVVETEYGFHVIKRNE